MMSNTCPIVWALANLRNKVACTVTEKQPIKQDVSVTSSNRGFKRQRKHTYLVTRILSVELEKRLLSQPNLGPSLILKGKSNSPRTLFLILLHFIFSFRFISVWRNNSNVPKKCRSSPKDFLSCMLRPVAIGSLNYNQRHNSFSNNGNLEDFVSVG